MRRILLLITTILMTQVSWAQITSASYNASNGELTINGSGFNTPGSVFPDSITIRGLNSVSYTLTSATPTINAGNPSTIVLPIEGIDRAYMNALFDLDGTTASNSDPYYLDVADGWHNSMAAQTDLVITVSSYAPPSITSATYDASTGELIVAGARFASDVGANNDIDPSKLTITGEAAGTITLSSTSGVEVTSHDEFTITLVDPDRSSVEGLLHINGTQSEDATNYDLTGAEDWNAASNGTDADGPGNTITVSNVPLVASASVTDNDICEGESVTLSANPSGGDGSSAYGFSWTSSPAGFTSSDENPVVSPTVTTTYTVEVTGGGTETSEITVTVHPLPTLTSSVISNPICSGSQFIYVPTSAENVSSFNWSRSVIPGIDEGASSSSGNIVETLTNTSNALVTVSYSYEMTTVHTCTNTDFVTVDVNAAANVDPISDIKVCVGETVPEIVFTTQSTDGITTYDWVNTNTTIGLAASGSGNIPEFTVTGSTEPELATITVTPTYTNGGESCQGTAEVFTILVNPNGQVNASADQVLCHNTNTTYVNFTTVNTNGTTTYAWTNTETDIGLAASGSDDIPVFAANNTGTSPLVGTIEVIPTFTYSSKSCPGTADQFTVEVNPTAQVDAVADQKLCLGDNTTAINFNTSNTGGTTTYNWVNDNTNIGLAASGIGDIASFTPTISGNAPELATITVTPTFDNGGASCDGPAEVFTILVNPDGQVESITDQVLCHNSSTTYVNYTTVNSGGTTVFDWTNSETGIGLAASGSNDIPAFTATNSGTSPLIGTIDVTPTFTYNGKSCVGSTESFDITVNPAAQVNVIADQKVCEGDVVAAVNFATINSGGTTAFDWVNDNTSIGLIASGSGNIVSFTSTNGSGQPQVANIVVTPEYTNASVTCSGPSESFSVLVNPNGQVNTLSDQLLCEGDQTNYVNFVTTNSVGTTVFDWANDNTSIGLAASGTDDIPSFTLQNGGNSPQIGTIEVTPEFSYSGKSCAGSPESFTITSNPVGQVNSIADMVFCNGDATGDINFNTTNIGGTTTYEWSNTNTTIGLAASGTGDILSFVAVNTGNSPKVATITVTPSYDNGGEICEGTPETFTITVNPNAQVNSIVDIIVCADQRISDINFSTTNVIGTTSYSWSNSNASIGLGIAGTGSISSFVGTNATQSQFIATIAVTPSYFYAGKSCSGTAENFQITVNPLPIVDFSMPQTTYGDDAPADTITGAIPYGGTFFGPGIIAQDSTFHPTSAGLGEHIISYAGFNGFGCRDTATASVSVLPPGGSITGLEAFYCDYAPKDTIRGRPDTGGTLDSIGCGFQPVKGLEIINDSIAVVNPALMKGENVAIEFVYYKGSPFSVINTTTIHNVVDTADFIGLPPGICVNENAVTLAGSPSGGTFFGTGISGDEFDPYVAGIGTYDISYAYTLGATGCKDTAVQTVLVHALTPTYFDADSLYCSNIDPVQLIGVPATGYFTGPNLSGTDTVLFSPNSSIVGPNTITYTYTNANGCISTHSEVVRVTQVATVGIEAINANYCENADSVELRGEVLGVFEAIGDFTGIGVNNNITNDGIGYFRPDLAGAGGPYEVTFTYTDSNSCVSTFSRNIVVRELPSVSINNLDDLYCINSPSTTISGVPQSGTGSFSYSGNVLDLNDLNDGTALFTPTVVTSSDTVIYTYTDAYGCTNSHSQSLQVVALPSVTFDSDTLFCPNGSSVQIFGEPPGGFFTGPNITGTDTVIFSPSESIIGTYNMTYTYTDTNSCTNSFTREFEIQELPTVGIVGLLNSYCVNGDSALLTATADGTTTTEGGFSGSGIFDEVADDGQAYFVPSDAGVGGPYTVEYTFVSLNNCVARAEATVLVRDLPTVSISSPSDLFCEGGNVTTITGIPQSSEGSFKYSGVISNLIDQGNGTAEFYPNNVIDTGIITYTFVDQYGCENSFNDSVKVSALPDVAFSMSSNCMGDTIEFTNQTVSTEPIASWAWDFGDPTSGANSSNDENPTHYYVTGGDKTISLTANTIDGCQDDAIQDVELGDAPIVDFSWENECFGFSPTIFINESDDTTSVFWDFGDGNTANNANPNHMFASVDSYDVTMEVTNQFGCSSEITKLVSIRPFIDSYPYLNDFEALDESWVVDVDSENSSWEIGVPDGTIINSAFSGQKSWVTGLVNSYENNEKSSVVSPCYDFSQIEKPMIKMQIWNSTQANVDGVVLQAKVDGETNWFNVGDLNDVINWYNGVGLQGNPGGSQNVGSYGWTGIENQWEEVRHELDELKGKTNVRFRIAFGSDASGTSDGFAFDDIWIGERTKRVLAESFTNSADNASAFVNPDFNELMINNASDIVDIQYHTGFPGTDPFNNENPADVAARATYYGLSQVPWAIFDGNVYSGSTDQAIDNYKLVEEQSLKDPVFAIDLETAANSNEISVSVDVTANENLSGKNLTLHTVMIESEVTSVTGDNGETQFFSVLRKMLPNAGGTGLNNTWTAGQTESFTFSWDFANAIDPDKVNVVVFIQDEDNQKVYQVATDDTATSMTWLPEIVLSFGSDAFMVYPNPTKEKINLLFEQPTQNGCWAKIYDMTGALITQKQLSNGVSNVEMSLDYLQQGIYLMKIFDQDGPLGTKRFIKQ
jgi:hypothetical protein